MVHDRPDAIETGRGLAGRGPVVDAVECSDHGREPRHFATGHERHDLLPEVTGLARAHLQDQVEQAVGVEPLSRSEIRERSPHGDEPFALLTLAFLGLQKVALVQRRVSERGLVDEADLVSGTARVGEDVLECAEAACDVDLGTELFTELTAERIFTAFTECDPAAERTKEVLVLHRVVALEQEDRTAAPYDAERDRAQMPHAAGS